MKDLSILYCAGPADERKGFLRFILSNMQAGRHDRIDRLNLMLEMDARKICERVWRPWRLSYLRGCKVERFFAMVLSKLLLRTLDSWLVAAKEKRVRDEPKKVQKNVPVRSTEVFVQFTSFSDS